MNPVASSPRHWSCHTARRFPRKPRQKSLLWSQPRPNRTRAFMAQVWMTSSFLVWTCQNLTVSFIPRHSGACSLNAALKAKAKSDSTTWTSSSIKKLYWRIAALMSCKTSTWWMKLSKTRGSQTPYRPLTWSKASCGPWLKRRGNLKQTSRGRREARSQTCISRSKRSTRPPSLRDVNKLILWRSCRQCSPYSASNALESHRLAPFQSLWRTSRTNLLPTVRPNSLLTTWRSIEDSCSLASSLTIMQNPNRALPFRLKRPERSANYKTSLGRKSSSQRSLNQSRLSSLWLSNSNSTRRRMPPLDFDQSR